MKFPAFFFNNRQACLDFVEKMVVHNPDIFGITPKDKIIEAINALDLAPPKDEAEKDVICHGIKYIIKIEIDIHSYGNKITNDGWMVHDLNKIMITREALIEYVDKKQSAESIEGEV